MQHHNLHPVSSPQPPNSLATLASVLRTEGEHLGDLVWWSLADARVNRSTLERLWASTNLPLSLLPEPPSDEKALKTAVREHQVGKGDLLIRLGKDAQDELVFALVRESRDGEGNVSHSQEARVTLRRATGTVTTDTPDHPDATALLQAFAALRHTHTADDVRRALVRALHSFSAVTLREGGGIYWVPRTHAEGLRALQRAVEQLGTSRFYLLPVHDSHDAVQSLGTVARGSLEEELSSLQEEIEAFKAEPPERASTLERRFEAFEALRTRANLYRDILSVHVDGLERHLTEMAEALTTLLQQKAA